MNSGNFLLFAILAIITELFMFNSCNKEQGKSLEVSPTSLQFDAGASDYQTVNITSNVSKWDAILSDSWCHLENGSNTGMGNEYQLGSGNGTIKIRVDENTSAYSRTSKIEVRDDDYQSLVKDITVYQAAGTGGSTGGGGGAAALPAPTGVTASQSGNSVVVSWNSVSGATSYKIFRSSSTSGVYTQLGSPSSTSYTDNSPLTGYNYYKVSAVNSTGEGNQSSYVSCNYTGGSGSGNTNVTFNSLTANGSSTQMTTQLTLAFSQSIAALSSSNITLSGLSSVSTGTLSGSGPTYTLGIEVSSLYTKTGTLSVSVSRSGYNISGTPKTVTVYSPPTKLGTPTGLTAYSGGSFVQISFSPVSLANSYELYRATSATGSYSKITASGGSSGGNYVLTDASPLTSTSYYKVKAIPLSTLNLLESDLSNYVSSSGGTAKPAAPTGVAATVSGSSIYITWYSVTGATSYNVYRSSSASGTYTYISSVSSSAAYDNAPLSGYNYYKITAVNSAGESPQSNYTYCNYSSSSSKPSSPTGLAASNLSGSSIYITWYSVTGATSYNVYRSSSATGTYTQICYSSQNYAYDNSPLSGYNYYKVTAVNSAGESALSSYVSYYYSGSGTTTKPSAPTGVTASLSGSSIYISWNSVSGATSYNVYWSSSASGTYSFPVGSSTQTHIYDTAPMYGYNYYKVTAVNSAGESTLSSYAACYK